MSEKFTLMQVASLLASKSETTKKQSETFLKVLFGVIAETLKNGESVKIKNLGTFKVVRVDARKSVSVTDGETLNIPAHNKVVFIPSKTMAEKVNREFSWLTTIELPEESEKSGVEEETIALPVPPEFPVSVAEMQVEIEVNDEKEDSEELGEELEKEFGEIEPVEPFGPVDPDDPEPGQPIEEEDMTSREVNEINESIQMLSKNIEAQSQNFREEARKSRSRSRRAIFCVFILFAALVTGGFFLIYGVLSHRLDRIEKTIGLEEAPEEVTVAVVENNASNSPVAEETAGEDQEAKTDKAVAPTAPSDILAVDKITTTRYLTTMAKEYYGNFNLWPYIYLENEKKLGHPDRIKPGTSIVVPNISKYNVDPSNPKDIEKAKALGVEIYQRFN